jgi:hypothetical protein
MIFVSQHPSFRGFLTRSAFSTTSSNPYISSQKLYIVHQNQWQWIPLPWRAVRAANIFVECQTLEYWTRVDANPQSSLPMPYFF